MVRHSPRAQDSRLTIAVDGRSPGDLYNLGEACLAPTQICPLLDRYGVRGRFRAPFPFTPAHNRRKSVQSAVWYRLCPEHSRSTIGVDGRSPGDLYNLGEARLAPTQICPLLDRYGVRGRFRAPFPFAPRITGVNLCNLRFGIACVRSIRGQPSGSMVVHLEIFTTWARHTSPLPRYAPDKTGTACRWRSMGIVSFAGRRFIRLLDHDRR